MTYHLEIMKDEEGFYIQNNINNINFVRIFSDIIFYLVDKYDLHILYEKFILSKESLLLNPKIIRLNLETKSLNDKAILYNHKYISVLLNVEEKS